MTSTDIRFSGQREALADRLVAGLSASMDTLGVWLGLRLGLYAALARTGAATASELAATAGIDARYAREWLEQQAVAGVLVTDDTERAADQRRYDLPAAHREVLLDEVSPYFVAPATYALAGIARVLPELLAAYRSGAGVPFAAYGEEIRDHIEQLNRPMFVNDLATSWLPAIPELHDRLQADPSCADGPAGRPTRPGAGSDGARGAQTGRLLCGGTAARHRGHPRGAGRVGCPLPGRRG